MEDLSSFASSYPQFCDPNKVRVPGYGTTPAVDGARPFELSAENLSAFRVQSPKDPATLPNMLKMGPEAVAFYVSFSPAPDRWGPYIRVRGVHALKEGHHPIIWREL